MYNLVLKNISLLLDHNKFIGHNLFSDILAFNINCTLHFTCTQQIQIRLENRINVFNNVFSFLSIRLFNRVKCILYCKPSYMPALIITVHLELEHQEEPIKEETNYY